MSLPHKRKRDVTDAASRSSPTHKRAKATLTVVEMTNHPKQQSKIDRTVNHPLNLSVATGRTKNNSRKRSSGTSIGFYQSNSGTVPVPLVQQNLNKLFDQYRDNPKDSPDNIGIDGAQNYLTAIEVELDEVAHLGICDLLQCPSIGEFEREAFVTGWRSVSTGDRPYDTTSRQAQYVDIIRKKLVSDPTYFKQVYRNAFKLAKPEGQRSVPVESAVDFWTMFFSSGKGGIEWSTQATDWLNLWNEFYQSQCKRPVNKDLWNMVGELVVKTREPDGESLAWWSENGAWPMAIDDFVAHVKEKRKAAGDRMDTS